MSKALDALLDYEQADNDGIMVLASRQAIHEVAAEIRQKDKVLDDIWDQCNDSWASAKIRVHKIANIIREHSKPTDTTRQTNGAEKDRVLRVALRLLERIWQADPINASACCVKIKQLLGEFPTDSGSQLTDNGKHREEMTDAEKEVLEKALRKSVTPAVDEPKAIQTTIAGTVQPLESADSKQENK